MGQTAAAADRTEHQRAAWPLSRPHLTHPHVKTEQPDMRKFLIGLVATLSIIAPLTLITAPAEAATGPQRQAIGMAQDYLRYSAFSKAGLVHQLRYEGFSYTV